MYIFIRLPDGNESVLKEHTNALQEFCKLFQIRIHKQGKLHYKNEFVLAVPVDMYEACLRLNAISAYCAINRIPHELRSEV